MYSLFSFQRPNCPPRRRCRQGGRPFTSGRFPCQEAFFNRLPTAARPYLRPPGPSVGQPRRRRCAGFYAENAHPSRVPAHFFSNPLRRYRIPRTYARVEALPSRVSASLCPMRAAGSPPSWERTARPPPPHFLTRTPTWSTLGLTSLPGAAASRHFRVATRSHAMPRPPSRSIDRSGSRVPSHHELGPSALPPRLLVRTGRWTVEHGDPRLEARARSTECWLQRSVAEPR